MKVRYYGIHAAALSPDGKRIVTGGGDSMLRVWDASSGKELKLFGVPNVVLNVRFLPGDRVVISYNRWVASGTCGTGNRVTRIRRARRLGARPGVLPDGKRVLTSWHRRDRPPLRDRHRQRSADVHRPRGLGAGRRRVARRQALRLGGPRPDGPAVGRRDGQGGAPLQRHKGRVLGVAWSNDGRRFITTSDDRTARVWDADSGKLIQRLEGFAGDVTCAAFLPGDRMAVVGARPLTDSTALVEVRRGRTQTEPCPRRNSGGGSFGPCYVCDDDFILTASIASASRRRSINQREVDRDTHGFNGGLRSALREDPDVHAGRRNARHRDDPPRADRRGHRTPCVRDAAHLVRGQDDRPHHRRVPGRRKADGAFDAFESLRAVISQSLLKKVGGGRIAAHEIMVGIPAIRNLIREDKVAQMYSVDPDRQPARHADAGSVLAGPGQARSCHAPAGDRLCEEQGNLQVTAGCRHPVQYTDVR